MPCPSRLRNLLLATTGLLGTVFPGTASEPAVPTLSIDELAARLGSVIIVDTRSHAEWEVMRLPTARCLPGHTITEGDLLDIRPREVGKPQIVFVGATGADAAVREAATRAQKWQFKSIAVLTGGVVEWSQRQPGRTLLFGLPFDSPEARSQRLKREEMESVMMNAAVFLEAARSRKFTVLEVRAPGQRVRRGLLPPPTTQLSPDELVWSLKTQSIPATRLLIADYDGSLLPSILFYLQAYGVTEFRCLRGGLLALQAAAPATSGTNAAPTPPAASSPPSAPPQTIAVKP
ncbi:MAG: rhodanese-like domain-containing protein [Verrucomicrobia bacterium]|nr:rhodanese-like domain-containing protein [Verrucomicrobiota bacterium]